MEENKGQVDLLAQLEAERKARQDAEERERILAVERDNYKTVALKRKGKLDSDDSFFGEHDEGDIERVIGEKVATTRAELEVKRAMEQKDAEIRKANEKLAEVLRAQELKPAGDIGSSAGGGQEVKDGIFSEAQLNAMKERWTSRGFNEESQKRMLETEKKNALSRRNIS